jgi:photosystem II stability/assembly factor-like uncharacterized protein
MQESFVIWTGTHHCVAQWRHTITLLSVGAMAGTASLPAQARRTPAAVAARPTALASVAAPLDTTFLRGLQWREVGPFRGGRSVAVSGTQARPNEYWMGTTGGGVFKTTDGGHTWTPMSDRYFGGTIGAVAAAPSNPDIVYVGGGEYPIRGNTSHGDGVWRTDNGGRTWTSLGLRETRHISRVRVHPTNPEVVWVAAQGHAFGSNPERGVFKSTDGGKNWRKVLFRNDSTGASDLVLDPTNPDVMYAAFWQAYRQPWMLVSGGTGGGMFKSIDGGETWTEITRNPGLPRGLWGNIGITVSGAKASRLWAIIENDSGGVFRSDDAGATWMKVNEDRKLRQRAWYYSKIHADSRDTNIVYVNNVNFHRSTDGGKTFRSIRAQHGDSHDFWIAPNDNQRFIEANDGGANVTVNGGRTFTDEDFATSQMYHVSVTNHFPYRLCGAQQDNSTLCGPSRSERPLSIADWQEAGGGESGYVTADPVNPDIIFAGSYGGFLTRKDMRTGLSRNVNPWPLNPMGHSAVDLKYRMQWTFPIVISPHDPKVMYVGSNVLFKSTDEGDSYTLISPDLSRNDPRTLGPSGGPITRDQTGVEYYGTVFALAESPLVKGLLWAGTDDGLVQLTRDGGRSWKNVTPPLLRTREWARVSIVEASNHAPGTAYIAANRFQLDDFQPYLFRTKDYGETWTRIDGRSSDGSGSAGANAIPQEEFTRVIREDPERAGLLYVGTERGLWASLDDGATWFSLRQNLPPVPVHDIALKNGDLIAGTHGRSFWILDDLSALRQLTGDVASAKAHLFQPRDVPRITWGGGSPIGARPTGSNPASGTILQYRVAEANARVTLEVRDSTGALVRSLTSEQDSAARVDSITRFARVKTITDSLVATGVAADVAARRATLAAPEFDPTDEDAPRRAPRPPRLPARQGLNRFAWNMRGADAEGFDGMIMWAGQLTGPLVAPGTYTFTMRVNDEPPMTRKAKILADPRSSATPADYIAQAAMLKRINERTTEANTAVAVIRGLRAQVDERMKSLTPGDTSAFATLTRSWNVRLATIEDSLYQTKNRSGQDPLNYPIRLNNQIAALAGVVASAPARPTRQSQTVFQVLSTQLDGEMSKLRTELGAPLDAINAFLSQRGKPPVKPGVLAPPATRAD